MSMMYEDSLHAFRLRVMTKRGSCETSRRRAGNSESPAGCSIVSASGTWPTVPVGCALAGGGRDGTHSVAQSSGRAGHPGAGLGGLGPGSTVPNQLGPTRTRRSARGAQHETGCSAGAGWRVAASAWRCLKPTALKAPLSAVRRRTFRQARPGGWSIWTRSQARSPGRATSAS